MARKYPPWLLRRAMNLWPPYLGAGIRAMGMFSVVLGIALAGYGWWFRKKARRVIT